MFEKSRSQVKWNGEIGNIFDNTQGVIQGGVISPLLFNIFLEDLPPYLNNEYGAKIDDIKIDHILQADDLVLISETQSGLQKLIYGLEKFCKRWHLEINTDKTKILIFNKRYVIVPVASKFFINSAEIEETDSYKYLGIIISNQSNKFA